MDLFRHPNVKTGDVLVNAQQPSFNRDAHTPEIARETAPLMKLR